jgi:ribosomal protein S18 acetylase RimI-like enzyme
MKPSSLALDKMTHLEFRQASPDDASLLARMNQQLIRDEGHRNPMSLSELEERMLSWLKNEYKAFLFFEEGTPVGYVLFRPDTAWLYLRQLFVLPEFQRQGIARAAITWLRSNIWQMEQRLRIEVLVHNQAAISFWRAVGFKDYALTMELEKSTS